MKADSDPQKQRRLSSPYLAEVFENFTFTAAAGAHVAHRLIEARWIVARYIDAGDVMIETRRAAFAASSNDRRLERLSPHDDCILGDIVHWNATVQLMGASSAELPVAV